jgi:hypothetical protein
MQELCCACRQCMRSTFTHRCDRGRSAGAQAGASSRQDGERGAPRARAYHWLLFRQWLSLNQLVSILGVQRCRLWSMNQDPTPRACAPPFQSSICSFLGSSHRPGEEQIAAVHPRHSRSLARLCQHAGSPSRPCSACTHDFVPQHTISGVMRRVCSTEARNSYWSMLGQLVSEAPQAPDDPTFHN